MDEAASYVSRYAVRQRGTRRIAMGSSRTGRWTIGLLVVLRCVVARAAEGPATSQAATAENLSPRQASILTQLANAEANIKTINKALVLTGYKVGVAYDRIDSNE